MNREEFLLKMKDITTMYSMPYKVENMQPIHNACVEYNKLCFEQQKEIERLNNIINELEKYLEEHSKIDYECNVTIIHEQMACAIILNKLKELKEIGNNES